VVPLAQIQQQKKKIVKDNIIPGIASIPITKQLDDVYKK
jgi:hypothetical protein